MTEEQRLFVADAQEIVERLYRDLEELRIARSEGRRRRELGRVRDVARALRLAMETPAAAGRVLNIGSGRGYSVAEVALEVAKAVARPSIHPLVTGRYRAGDIRHCFADISEARRVLGYEPRVALPDGLRELAAWLETQTAVDRAEEARGELESRGLAL